MSTTSSLAFPNMFDVSRNSVAVLEDTESVVNRSRLLILTEPTELYNSPNFGVGMKKYMWQYNNPNIKAMIRDNVVEQLRLHEPYVKPEETNVVDGLLFTGDDTSIDVANQANGLDITLSVNTTFETSADIDVMQKSIFGSE